MAAKAKGFRLEENDSGPEGGGGTPRGVGVIDGESDDVAEDKGDSLGGHESDDKDGTGGDRAACGKDNDSDDQDDDSEPEDDGRDGVGRVAGDTLAVVGHEEAISTGEAVRARARRTAPEQA